jgi:hypothetical protein
MVHHGAPHRIVERDALDSLGVRAGLKAGPYTES